MRSAPATLLPSRPVPPPPPTHHPHQPQSSALGRSRRGRRAGQGAAGGGGGNRSSGESRRRLPSPAAAAAAQRGFSASPASFCAQPTTACCLSRSHGRASSTGSYGAGGAGGGEGLSPALSLVPAVVQPLLLPLLFTPRSFWAPLSCCFPRLQAAASGGGGCLEGGSLPVMHYWQATEVPESKRGSLTLKTRVAMGSRETRVHKRPLEVDGWALGSPSPTLAARNGPGWIMRISYDLYMQP